MQTWIVRRPGGSDLPFATPEEAFAYMITKRPRGAKLYAPDGSVLLTVGEAPPDA